MKHTKRVTLWVLIGLMIIGLFKIYQHNYNNPVREIALSDFIRMVENKKINKVELRGQYAHYDDSNKNTCYTYIPSQYNAIRLLLENNVESFDCGPSETTTSEIVIFIFHLFFPLIIVFCIWFFFFRQMQNIGGRNMGLGGSKAKMIDVERISVRFDDVKGIDSAKDELKEVVDFLKDPQEYKNMGARIPKGVLLVGPPGTGKTMLAKAVAGEARVPFFTIAGSDFMEVFVGIGASRVRSLFAQARENAPCIVFIDEIDTVGRSRASATTGGGGHDEREQTLNQLLVEMDGFESQAEVIVMAATNRADVLDKALLRPGRFDRQVYVDLPDVIGREAIIKVHIQKVPYEKTLDFLTIARGTPGFSGADLANLVNEAALRATRLRKKEVDMEDFEASRDKIMMGSEKLSYIIKDEDRKVTAYHEAGHALVSYHMPESDPIHKATIIPRGHSLGMVVRFPQEDRISMNRAQLHADLAIALAGRIAEEIVFGPHKITTGASSDFHKATKMARRMVTEWGMSDTFGTLFYPDQDMLAAPHHLSEHVLTLIDTEAKKLIDHAYAQAKNIITQYRAQLDMLAEALLEKETLTGPEIHTLFQTQVQKALENITQEDDTKNIKKRVTRKKKLPPAENK